MHDNENRIIAELNATGTTIREYVWLEDIPVAVLDGSTNTANPSLFFVHADHLNRPIAMSNASRDWVWRAQYEPFGAVHQIVGPAANDNRFPGQMFQLEAGLAYNWHRHYDASLGRYTQPDPLGLQTLLSDGPSVYGYVGQSPLMWVDPSGQSGQRINLGDGYTGRIDRFNTRGGSSFEMHVFDKKGNEVGVYGPDGWIKKHGYKDTPNLPPNVEEKCKNVAADELRRHGGITRFLDRTLKRMSPVILPPGVECVIPGFCKSI